LAAAATAIFATRAKRRWQMPTAAGGHVHEMFYRQCWLGGERLRAAHHRIEPRKLLAIESPRQAAGAEVATNKTYLPSSDAIVGSAHPLFVSA